MSLIFVLAIFCTYPKAVLPLTSVTRPSPKTPSGKLVRRRVR